MFEASVMHGGSLDHNWVYAKETTHVIRPTVTESRLALLTARQANIWRDKVLRQGIATLFGKPADREDGGLGSPKSHLIGVWMPVSFIEQRGGGGEEVK